MKKLLIITGLALMTAGCTKQQSTGLDLSNLDTTAVAQNDFYQYACGGWMAQHPLTAEYSRYGSFDAVREENNKQLNALIGDIAGKSGWAKGSIEQKIADVYNMALDTARRDAEGAGAPPCSVCPPALRRPWSYG